LGASLRTFRLFLSSPGDADVERRRAETVVSRLNGEFSGLARLETVRWETEHYKAHATFQAQIPPAADCDIVVGVLRWRLGLPLPPDFPDKLPDGAPYPSGTAYEILTAVERRKAGAELPDVFVFRYDGGAPRPELGQRDYDETVRQWEALRGFFARWFVTPQGQFQAAFNSYGSEDHFERQLETLLRKWLSEKAAGGRVVSWPAIKGSPFRGLSVFGAKHAPVFFGRAGDVRRAVDLWRDVATNGAPFLLIVGASGAGKSSLARAGLLPRLTTPGVAAEVDLWRVVVMRPGDSPDGPFAALAAALLQREADLPAEEEGRGPALPEIAEGDCKTPAELAAVLAHADAGAARPIVNALDRIAVRAKDAERYGRDVRCDLALLIDQLDELFAPSLAPDVRTRFADLMAALVGSGRVWLVATLRADLYAPMLETPALKALKDKGASYDLAPPGAAELAEIVRAPAAAAALTFETNPTSGERLDERLLREADRPDMLPLVQLALSRLWEARETEGANTLLSLAAFEKLGGVKGIVEEAGEAALAKLGETERERLPPLIRRLAEVSHGGALTARPAPLAEAAPDAPAKALVDALVAARLLTLAGEGGGALVRLAHQRVLTDWTRVAKIVADSADFYRVRDEVEDQRRRWEAGKRRGELLLARGLPLAEARDMAARYGVELPPAMLAFIAASGRRAGRAQAIAWAAAAAFALVAIGAGVAAKAAFDQKQIADRNFAAAKTTVDGLIFNIAQGLQNVAGMRVETIRTILETTRRTVDQLLASAPNDPRLLRSQSVMLQNFATTYWSAGDLKDAISAAAESLDIARKLAAQDPGNALTQRDVSVSLVTLGEVKLRAGDQAGALAAYQESLDIARKLTAQDQGNAQAPRILSLSLNKIGSVKLQAGDQAGALAAYQESLGIFRKLAAQDQGNVQAQRDVALSLERLGDVKLQAGDQPGALAADQESLDIARKLAAQDQGNAQAQSDVSESLRRLGSVKLQAGDQAGALAAYQESLDIARKLAAQDQGNALAQRDVALSLEGLGDVKLQAGDQKGALAAYQESLDIDRKLAAQDQGNAQAQRDVSVSLSKLGDVKLWAGDQAGALAAYQESLDILRKLAAQDQGNAQAQRDVSVSLEGLGDVKLQAGDQPGALAAYQEDLDITRKLAAQDPGNAQAQRDLSVSLSNLGVVKRQAGNQAGTLAAFQESVDIARKLVAQDPGNAQAQRDMRVSLNNLGDTKLRVGDQAGALAAYQEDLDIARKLAAQDQGNARAQSDLANALGRTAYATLLAKGYAKSLALSDEAIAIAPDQLWLYTNRAHALMLLGRTDEARAIYLEYRSKMEQDGKPWEHAITGDFAALRAEGITNPLMDEIEADFAKPAVPTPPK
jgi:tetratricopeptide (TPR) repeat protein